MIQDELSEEAKEAILACVKEALRGHFSSCTQEVADELEESEYGVLSLGDRFRLSKTCIDEISSILSMDFFN